VVGGAVAGHNPRMDTSTAAPAPTAPEPPCPLPDGLVLRTGTPGDLDQIGALLADRGEPADAVDHRLVVSDPDAGWGSCAVVVDGDRVVSTLTLLDETLVLGGVEVPAGQVELVATERAYEGRGLVRALMAWAHRRSAALGQLAQVMIGIPYFYRQFGYAYAIPIAPALPLASVPAVDGDARHRVRAATSADIPAMTALQDRAQAGRDLRMPHSGACWRWLLARDGSTQWVVERDGAAVATGRSTPPEEGVHLAEVAAVDAPAAHALFRHAAGLAAAAGDTARVADRPGTVAGDALAPLAGPAPEGAERYYARIPDLAALLEHLRPVLAARLAASALADAEGEAVVSLFRSHLRFPYAAGEVGPVTTGGTMQAPGVAGGAGVAPDLVAPLLFGPDGITAMSRVHPDVYPGPNAELMDVLFPPIRADLLTFYLP
jgi:predicted N-acetyltransferase YhbS